MAVVVVEYIIFHGTIEEHKMSEDLNLPFREVRQALMELNKHQILTSIEGRRDRRHEERSGNMFTRGPDQGRMVYWRFDPDIKNILCTRIIKLRKSLDDLVEEANKILFKCEKCSRNFTIEEAVPNYKCNMCPNSDLKRVESSIEKAKELRQEGINQIKNMENLMKECLDVTLPTSFFGAAIEINDAPPERSTGVRHVRPTIGGRGYAVDINLPELEMENKNNTINAAEHDNELIKYYQKVDRRSQRRKAGDDGGIKFNIEGVSVDVKEINGNMQVKMTDDEFSEYYKWKSTQMIFL
ncbi:hypothetical protein SteCoe_21913 [Stentor coeruleus]|uniref:Transcription initiation factor IIE subunit alpha N-terminal domain-containing protein n=1 Tax=Stentor coeruleus TaxID=5963 RepID=A0A1R2BNN1_9CILI|nr:hypothetical protein SteCoe_21913 [Stentor coeruleus]